MKTSSLCRFFLAVFGLIHSSIAPVQASPPTADVLHDCLPMDRGQRRQDHPEPAAKRALNLNVGEPRTVRVIYFLPNDIPYDQERVDLTKTMIRQVRMFYTEQMEAHGYGSRTFRFEIDAAGDPIVHRVDGRHPYEYYHSRFFSNDEIREIGQRFDLSANIYLVNFVTDGSSGKGYATRNTKMGGLGVGTIHGNEALPSDFDVFIHELGHAFGLPHDFRDDSYMMSYGYPTGKDKLSACNARSLAVHPYFNADSATETTGAPTIELTSSLVRRDGERSVPIEFKVSDSDGLHQVLLHTSPTEYGVGEDGRGLKACRALTGENEAFVVFDYDGDIPGLKHDGLGFGHFERHYLTIQAIDVLGNTLYKPFELVDEGYVQPIAVLEHEGGVNSLSFSPDGRLLAVAGPGMGVANVWDVSTGEHVASFQQSGDHWSHSLLTFSPDGKLLATRGGEDVVNLWDVSTGEHVTALEHGARVRSFSFSTDGTVLGSAGGGAVNLWDVSTSQRVIVIGAGRPIRSVTFSPDGELLGTAGIGTVDLWDVSTAEHVTALPVENARWTFDSVSFSPDGRRLAAGGNSFTSVVKLWNVSTGRSFAALAGRSPVAFSPSGRLLASIGPSRVRHSGSGRSAKRSSVVKLWSVSTGQSIATVSGGRARTTGSLVFSPDGRQLAVGSLDKVEIWNTSEWMATDTPQLPRADFDGDGTVGFSDFVQFAAQFGLREGDAGYDPRFDLDGDGTVGFSDFVIFAGSFGQSA